MSYKYQISIKLLTQTCAPSDQQCASDKSYRRQKCTAAGEGRRYPNLTIIYFLKFEIESANLGKGLQFK